jgi:hypothetical protein
MGVHDMLLVEPYARSLRTASGNYLLEMSDRLKAVVDSHARSPACMVTTKIKSFFSTKTTTSCVLTPHPSVSVILNNMANSQMRFLELMEHIIDGDEDLSLQVSRSLRNEWSASPLPQFRLTLPLHCPDPASVDFGQAREQSAHAQEEERF